MYSRHTSTMPTCLYLASGGAASQDISKDLDVPPGIIQAQQKPSQGTLFAKTASSHTGTSSEGTMSSNQSELTSPSASRPPDYMPYYMRDQLAARAAGLGSQGQPSDTPRAESQQSTQTTPAKSVQGYAPVQVMPESSQQLANQQKGLPKQANSSGQVQGLPSMPQPAHSLQMQQASQSLGTRTVLVTPLAPSARSSWAAGQPSQPSSAAPLSKQDTLSGVGLDHRPGLSQLRPKASRLLAHGAALNCNASQQIPDESSAAWQHQGLDGHQTSSHALGQAASQQHSIQSSPAPLLQAKQALPSNTLDQQSLPSRQPAPQLPFKPDRQSGSVPVLNQAQMPQLPLQSSMPQRLLSVTELEGKQQGRDSPALSSMGASSTAARGKPPPGFLPVSRGNSSPLQDGQVSDFGAAQPAASQLGAFQAETGIAQVPEQVPRAQQHQEAHQVRRQRL